MSSSMRWYDLDDSDPFTDIYQLMMRRKAVPQSAGASRREKIKAVTSDLFKNFGYPTIGIVLALAIFVLLAWVPSEREDSDTALALLVLGGLVVLILVLAGFVALMSSLKLVDKSQAFGLPDGTIRALLAVSLLVVFVGLSTFLYGNFGGTKVILEPAGEMPNVPEAQVDAEMKKATLDFTYLALRNADGTYTIRIFTRRLETVEDDAKNNLAIQIFTYISTVLVTVIGFYFGSRASAAGNADPTSTDPAQPDTNNIGGASGSTATDEPSDSTTTTVASGSTDPGVGASAALQQATEQMELAKAAVARAQDAEIKLRERAKTDASQQGNVDTAADHTRKAREALETAKKEFEKIEAVESRIVNATDPSSKENALAEAASLLNSLRSEVKKITGYAESSQSLLNA